MRRWARRSTRRKKLRRDIARSAVPHPAFHRPPRRLPDLIGILPAQCRLAVKPVVMAVIDTSDSMVVALLEIIMPSSPGWPAITR